MEIKTTLDNSVANYAKNLRDLSIQLNFDKGSDEAKVSIKDFEFIKQEAELLLKKVQGEGLGIMFGVPYKVEIGEKGLFETILDGQVDLTQAQKFSCREVIAPVIDKGENDFLTKVADSFTFDFLFERRPDLLNSEHLKFVPYIRAKPDKLEIASAVFSLILLSVQIGEGIFKVVKSIKKMSSFDWGELLAIVSLISYILLLIVGSISLIAAILAMIIQPKKFHAGMSALKLCQIGAEYKGFQFSSTILEGEFKDMVIIPPKNEIVEDKDNSLLTGYAKPTPEEQTGHFQGTFGELLRSLMIMFNAKIIIEDTNGEGSQKIIRLEREDFNTSQELYTLPNTNIDDEFTLNTDEFNAVNSLRYLTDELDVNTYQFFGISNVTEVLEPIDKGNTLEYSNLFSGYNETLIPFSLGVKNTSEKTKIQDTIESLALTLQVSITVLIIAVNDTLLTAYNVALLTIDKANEIFDSFGINQINPPAIAPEEINITIPDISSRFVGREDAMLLEKELLSTHRVVLLSGEYGFTLSETIVNELGLFSTDDDFAVIRDALLDKLARLDDFGEFELVRLREDNNQTLSALNIYKNFHQINSFLPTEGNEFGNQWKRYEANNVKFCLKDWKLLKNDNRFKNENGQTCLLESLEWFPFKNKADFKFRVNEQYIFNIELKDGKLLTTSGR